MTDLRKNSGSARKPNFELSEAEVNSLIKEYEGYPTSSGRTQYLRYLQGEKLTYREAGLAKCTECCNGYVDGRYDCVMPACPLYQFMPYIRKGGQSIFTDKY